MHTREGHKPDLSDLSASKKERQTNAPDGHHSIGIGEQGPMGKLLVRGEYGHDIVDELRPLPGEVVIDKPGKGSFWATGLHRKLMARGITHILLCGVTTECCVTTTAREANDRGFESCILRDATGGFNESFVNTSLDMISAYDGLFGFTAYSKELLSLNGSLPSSITTPPQTPPDVTNLGLDLGTLQKLYRDRVLSASDVMGTVWTRIQDYQKREPNVWIHLRKKEDIIGDVEALCSKYPSNSPEQFPVLYGVPFAIKDNIDVAGIPTTAACPDYTYTPDKTAAIVSLLQAAGAILIGKTNMDQFATGLSGCRSPWGSVRSVYGESRISGGSSSGSAVAVAAGLVTFSLGTDTAGSGRVPAALNGIVGFKPTKGTVSARGIVPACRSLDTASVFALGVDEARQIWHVVDQQDETDIFSKDVQSLPLALADYRGVAGHFAFATPPPSALADIEPAYRKCFEAAVAALDRLSGAQGYPLTEEEYGPFSRATELLYKGTLVHERIACIGHDFLAKHMDKLHPTTRTLFQAVYAKNDPPWQVFSDQAAQMEATRFAAKLFGTEDLSNRTSPSKRLDILVLPTVGCHPTIEEMEADPIGLNARMGTFTHFANVMDLCAISVHAGWTEDGLPFGLSLVGGKGMDGRLLSIAAAFERSMKMVKD
jgi:allophanate hydrolase